MDLPFSVPAKLQVCTACSAVILGTGIWACAKAGSRRRGSMMGLKTGVVCASGRWVA